MNTEPLLQVAPDSSEAPQQVTLTRLERIIERMTASYLADVRALCEELRQPVQATEHEMVDVLPSERAQPQDTRSAQAENASTGFPDPELLLPPPAAALPQCVAEVGLAAAPELRAGATRLGARTVHLFYWVLLWGVFLLIGVGLGVLVALMLAAW